MASQSTYRYRAFISYSHDDARWAEWLHESLESYHIDRSLVGKPTAVGPVPKTLRPIFRDRFDFAAGGTLRSQTLDALDQSDFLIVICSPTAAHSEAVFEEIRLYKMKRGPERIVPLIVEGEPGDPERECFPHSLAYKVGTDGQLLAEPEEPIAADARPEGDGRHLARLKVTAGLLGVPLDELYRREARTRRRALRLRSAIAGGMGLLALGATASAWTAMRQTIEADRLLQIAFDATSGVSRRSADLRDQFAVPVPAIASMLAEAESTLVEATMGKPSLGLTWEGLRKIIAKLRENPATSPESRHRRALMLMSFADSYKSLGEIKEWLRRAQAARELMRGLVNEAPDDPELQRDLTRAHNLVGDALTQEHNVSGALAEYLASHGIAKRLVEKEPANAEWQSALAKAFNELGDAYTQLRDLEAAMRAYRGGFDIRTRLSAAAPQEPRWQRDVSISWNMIGDTHRHGGKLAEALAAYEEGYAIRRRLVAESPGNQTYERDLSISQNYLGDTLMLLGDVAGAQRQFEAAYVIRKRHAEDDPRNVQRQRDLAFSHYRLGSAATRLGKSGEALPQLHAALAIFQRLAQSDPGNARWQVDVLNAHWRLAEAGDEPRRRFDMIVSTFRRLRDEQRLLPEHHTRLAEAEERLKKLMEHGL